VEILNDALDEEISREEILAIAGRNAAAIECRGRIGGIELLHELIREAELFIAVTPDGLAIIKGQALADEARRSGPRDLVINAAAMTTAEAGELRSRYDGAC
jgi:hypothetical protein